MSGLGNWGSYRPEPTRSAQADVRNDESVDEGEVEISAGSTDSSGLASDLEGTELPDAPDMSSSDAQDEDSPTQQTSDERGAATDSRQPNDSAAPSSVRSSPSFGQPGRLTQLARPNTVEPPSSFDEVAPRPASATRSVGPRIIAIANQKGGVGKTTTTVNMGAAAAELGHRVLIVDLDPQGNASTGLGINPRSLEASMYDVLLHDVPLDEAIEATEVRNLFVAPANLDLAGAEIELVPAFSRELRLKNAIATVAEDFDLVLIDCPPSLGLLTVNAFAAASEVLVPIQCEYYALEGLGQLLRNIDLVKRNLNASLELSAIVLVMYDARTNLAAQVAAEVREHFGSKVCRAVIPRNIRLSEAPSFGQPITVFDPSSRGAIAYRDLAKEIAGEPT